MAAVDSLRLFSGAPWGMLRWTTMAKPNEAVRTAQALARLYGDRAELEAGELWQFYKERGATNAARVWQSVLTTLATMRAERQPPLH
jgi:hypothetical protein